MAKKFDRSERAFEVAKGFMPGGVNSPVRAFGGVDLAPLFIDRAAGSRIWDVDGNEYIDYVCSWGPMILGHGHPTVLEAIEKAARKGTSLGAPTLAETELARLITRFYPSIEKLRMVSSGTEAGMSAIRLARAFTGRDLIIKMDGCYHGHSDGLLVAAGSGLAECGRPSSGGVPAAVAALTVVVAFNDLEAVRKAFDKYRGRIAGVIVEPVACNMGVVAPAGGYLDGVRKLCSDNGSVLIFDEVITGCRLAKGGAQELYGVKADITCLGKIIGGGLPAAAFGGRAEIMDLLAPVGGVYQAGTLSGNPLATAGAIATLEILSDADVYERLEVRSAALQDGLTEAAKAAGVAVRINRVGSVMSCFFTGKPVKNFTDVCGCDIGAFKRFFAMMLKNGIYLAPSAYEAMFVSLAHSESDIDETIAAARESFEELKIKN